MSSAARCWLPPAIALLLTVCGPAATQDQPTGQPPTRPAPTAQRPVPAASAFAAQPAAASAVPGPVAINTVRLPGHPDFQVPQLPLETGGELAARRINQALTRLLITDNLENQAAAPDATAAIRRAVAAYEAEGQVGMTSAGFKVLYNQDGLLSLALYSEYMGAYPSTATQHATFDVRTGRRLALPDLLADTLALRRRWHQRVRQRLATHLRAVAHDYPGDSAALESVRYYTHWDERTHDISPSYLPPLRDFALTEKGLLLFTSFEFAHVVLALCPDEEYVFSYQQVLPWAGPRSLLPRKAK